MNRQIAFIALLLTAMLAGCAQVPPAPTSTSSPLPAPPPARPVEEPRERDPEMIQPDAVEPERETSPAAGLIEQGWRYHAASDYPRALASAERAQRIAPRDPEVYLLMASAQWAMARGSVAEQLIRKGLALSQSGTLVHRQLQSLLGQVSAGR